METAELVKQGRNVLVFQPGKKEINDTIEELGKMNLGAVLLPLHGDLDPEEQQKVFNSYSSPKVIVATNVAQTSITIEDIDAVVDSGLERRVETIDGIQGLYLRRTSRADDTQRKGRSGRCKPGLYINCYSGYDEQLEFPVAEIQRLRLDQLVLRLAIQGFDATELDFFHQPDPEMLSEAKRSLHALGAIDKNEKVTGIGKKMNQLPISVNYARMIIEAIDLGVLSPVLTIAACLEVNGINDHSGNWRFLTDEKSSDLLAQLDLFKAARSLRGNEELRKNGIFVKSYSRALEIRKKLVETIINIAQKNRTYIDVNSDGDYEKIIPACVSGMVDHLYRVTLMDKCINGDSTERRINRSSVTLYQQKGWVVGLPLDLEVKAKRGGMITLSLVNMVTIVDPQILTKVAPHLVQVKQDLGFDIDNNEILFMNITVFNGQELPDPEITAVSWQELHLIEKHFPPELTPEQLRRNIILTQLDAKRQYPGPLAEKTILEGIYFELRANPKFLDPVEYGIDPATGAPLYAYPAIVIKDDKIGNMKLGQKTCRVYTASAQVANALREKFPLLNPSSPTSTLSSLTEIKVTVKPNDESTSVVPEKLDRLSIEPAEPEKSWEDLRKRWWKCPKGHTAKAAKNATSVTCDICKQTHDIE